MLAPWRNGKPQLGASFKGGDTAVTVWMIQGGSFIYPAFPSGRPSGAIAIAHEEWSAEWPVQTFLSPAQQAAKRKAEVAAAKARMCACGNFKTSATSLGDCPGFKRPPGTSCVNLFPPTSLLSRARHLPLGAHITHYPPLPRAQCSMPRSTAI
jgi:hypothetical protein